MSKKYKPVVITSLHGFKSHGKWQSNLSNYVSSKSLPTFNFDYGYQFLSCLVPGFKSRIIQKFYHQYCLLIKNKDYKIDITSPYRRPSIVVHSLGSYILCQALLKHQDIKFDKIILCGSIVDVDFDWDTILKRNQAHFVRNEYSSQDDIVKWGWILTRSFKNFSGLKGFACNSNAFEQAKFDYFEHSTFFDGNHMQTNWLPFFLKPPPDFNVIRGSNLKTISEFSSFFEQSGKIDLECFGNDPTFSAYPFPENLAEDWISSNTDIYSFLTKEINPKELIGYINAMPLKKDVFDLLLDGKIHDNEISKNDILAYDGSQTEMDLYIMSIAISPNYQQQRLGLKDLTFEKLFNSLMDKLSEYYDSHRIKINRIASVGWTEKGIRLSKMMGMKDSGKVEEGTNKPIYILELNSKIDRGNTHKSILRLVDLYNGK